jgi:hypothetical protein
MGVVKSDIKARGAITPPKRSASRAAPFATIRTSSVDELESELTELLLASQPASLSSEIAGDGSPRVASLVAVWLISQAGAAVGRPKLVRLSQVRREDLRSLGGVARLLHRTLHPVPVDARAAS